MKKVNYLVLMLAAMALMSSCNKISYRKSKSGLVYKIFPSNGKDSLLKMGQIAKFHYIAKLNDSVLYSSYGKVPGYAKLSPLPMAPYNLLEILPMMKKGDSAVTVQMADTLLKKGEQLPPSAKKGDRITTTMRITDVFESDSLAMKDYNAETEKDMPPPDERTTGANGKNGKRKKRTTGKRRNGTGKIR
jgi:hypothetical protein